MKKLLLIDDDSAIHLIASAALQRAGAFKIGFARTGYKGIERAKATRPDLILLDALLPDIDGEEVLRRLRSEESLHDTPVIFLTAKGGDAGFDFKAMGAQGLISKPFDPDHLAEEIRQVLGLEPEEFGFGGNGSGNGHGNGNGNGNKPAMPSGGSIDRLRRSFVERGCKEVDHLISSVGPRFDVDAARRIAHLWVGRGGTLGHPQVSVVARRLELRLADGWGPEKRWRVQSDLRDVKGAFEAAWKIEKRQARKDAPKEVPKDLSEDASQEDTADSGLLVLDLDAPDPDIGVAGLQVALPTLPSGDRTASPAVALARAQVDPDPAEQRAIPLTLEELPREFRDVLVGRTVALFGFDQCDSEAMREVFSAAEVTIKSGELGLHIERREDLAHVDVAVISIAAKQAEMAWEQVDTLARAGVPCLAIGPGRQLLSGAGHAGSCEFLLAPWCAEEVLLRCYQLVTAAALADVSAAANASVAEDVSVDADSVGAPEQPAAVNNNIVIADDDPTITALVEMTLREVGLICHIASGGEDALELIGRIRPGAVVLDVNMPQMDGFEVLAAVRNDPVSRSIPVVMLTALRQEADVIRGFRLGADDYVVKPFNPMELSARLERLIRSS